MQKFSKEERRAHIRAWQELGISGQEYCRQNGIRPTTFYNWLKREKEEQSGTQSTPLQGLVRISPATTASAGKTTVAVEYQGILIHLPMSNLNDILPSVISALTGNHVS